MTTNTQHLRELLAKATPGDWTWKQVGSYQTPGCAIFWPDTSKGGVHYRRLDSNGGMLEADADLIAKTKRQLPALLDELEDYRANGAQAVRWAPSSAHWSTELERLFGDVAREGIDALEKRLRDTNAEIDALRAENERLRDALKSVVDVYAAVRQTLEEKYPEDGWSAETMTIDAARAALAQQAGGQTQPLIARALADWHEDDGPVAWWAWCGHEWAGEPAWVGTPLDSDWPGYHTHWTAHPTIPLFDARAAAKGDV